MPRTAIQNANASPYWSGAGGTTVSSSDTTLVIGNSTNTSYSWGVRAKLASRNPANNVFFSKSSTKYPLQFRVEAGGLVSAAMYDGVTSLRVTSTKTYADSAWHTFVGVRAGSSLKLYVDGVLANSGTQVIGDSNEASNVVVAGSTTTGNMSDAFITLNALTVDEVLAQHQTGTLPYSCVLRLPLDEGAGSIAYDSSGNGNDGTITSGTWTRDTPTKTRKAVGGNMVFNGDFEIAPVVNVPTTTQYRWIDGTASGNNVPTTIFGWGLESLTGTGGAQFDTSVKYSGNASMKLSTSAVSSTVEVSQKANSSFINSTIPVLPSTSYTATCRIKTNITSGTATTGAQLRAIELQGNNSSTAATNTIASGIVTTQDWTQYTATFTTASNTRFIKMVCRIVNDGAATLIGDAWFDDITLTKTTPEARTAISGPYRRPVTNMIPNSDFEYAPSFTAAAGTAARWIDGTASGSSATKGPYGWALSYVSGTVGASFDSTVSRSGTYSLKLSQLDTSSDVVVSQSKLSSTPTRWELNNQLQAALPSTSYTLTLWAKTNNVVTNGVYADIREFNGAGSAIVTSPTAKLSGTNDWTRLSLTLTTNSSTRFIGIMLRNTVGGNVCDAWFDDITLDLTSNTSRTVA